MDPILFVCLAVSTLPRITAKYEAIFPTEPIKAQEGSNATLRCRLDPSVNSVHDTSVCYRADLFRCVHIHPHTCGDDDLYRGRTTLVHEDRGVLTLQISSVRLSDAGPYRCLVPRLMARCTINLTVGKRETPSTTRPPLDPVTEPEHPEVRKEEEEKQEEEKKEEDLQKTISVTSSER